LLPGLAAAGGRVGIGVQIGGPGYYHHPYYGPRAYYYYPPPYYYYGPGYYYYYPPPPQTVYAEPPETVEQAPPAYWYYCPDAKAYYPYVKECGSGWQAVPAQAENKTPPPQQGSSRPAPVPAPQGKVTYRMGDLLFAPGQAELQPAALATLDALVASIAKEPDRHLVVEGHTDSTGDEAGNRELSQRRADAVMQYLVAHGVSPSRISAVGKGQDNPIASNDTAEGRKRNRRVDVVVS
jgi:outer membrane protein OmpA-like peptidoglycan-associated protein